MCSAFIVDSLEEKIPLSVNETYALERMMQLGTCACGTANPNLPS
jgi:hypothetical protein